jgi:hypothetical protein
MATVRRLSGYRLVAILAVCTAPSSCRPPPPRPPVATPIPFARSAPHPSAAAGRRVTAPAEHVEQYVDVGAALVGHLDARKLRKSFLYAAYRGLIQRSPVAAEKLGELTRRCGFDPVQAVDEIALSMPDGNRGPDESRQVIAVATSRPAQELLGCVLALAPEARAATLDGRAAVEAWSTWMVAEGQVAVFGREEVLRKLFAAPRPRSETRLAAGNYLLYRPAPAGRGLRQVRVSLDTEDSATVLDLSAEGGDESVLQALPYLLAGLQQSALMAVGESHLIQPVRGQLERLIEGLVARREGMTLTAVLRVSNDEIAALGTNLAAALAVYEQRRAADVARAEAVKRHLVEIAAKLKAYGEAHGRFPPSAPRVPRQIPRTGERVTVPAAAWKHPSWKAIGFRLREGLYFSYQFVTAPDGKKVDILGLDQDEGATPRVRCWQTEANFRVALPGVPAPAARAVEYLDQPYLLRPCSPQYAQPAGALPSPVTPQP